MYAAISRDERMIDRETMGNLFGADVPADSRALLLRERK